MSPDVLTIEAVLVGRTAPLGPKGVPSGIAKSAVSGPVRVGPHGLDGDEQGDRRNHGGPEKALHHYARDHYDAWRRELPGPPAQLAATGAFGENLSCSGLTEAEACVGDLWRAGTALLQVSQARQPCWKLNAHLGVADMARRVQASGRTGWYYRVIEPGVVRPGDELRLADRPRPDWPLARLLHAFYVDRMDRDALEGIAALDGLAVSWRELATRRLARGAVESWTARLDGQG